MRRANTETEKKKKAEKDPCFNREERIDLEERTREQRKSWKMSYRQDTGSVTKEGESRTSWRIIVFSRSELVPKDGTAVTHTFYPFPVTSCSPFLSRLIISDAMSFSSACYRLPQTRRQDCARIFERSAGTDSFPFDDDDDADLNTSFPLPASLMSTPCATRTTDRDPNRLPISAKKGSQRQTLCDIVPIVV